MIQCGFAQDIYLVDGPQVRRYSFRFRRIEVNMRNLRQNRLRSGHHSLFQILSGIAALDSWADGAARMEFYACIPHLHVVDAGLCCLR